DFITLMFAFFVVMYSISQVNEAKYKELSTTLKGIFNTEAKSTKPIQVGDPIFSALPSAIDSGNDGDGHGAFDSTAELPVLESQLRSEFADLIEDEQVELDSNELWLQLTLPSNVLFASGSARPSELALALFSQLADKLRGYDNQLQIEGYTDNRAISSARFPSNWELSAARAAAVVKLLIDAGLRPQRLAALGYGEFRPVASNETAEGRAKNRRVVVMVSRRAPERLSLAAAEAMASTGAEGELSRAAKTEAATRAAALAEMRALAEQRLLAELAAEAEAKAAAEKELPPLEIEPQKTEQGVLYRNDEQ
ncbi:MAG: OmpA family protein, partial [Cellvibrionaceae bacterium]|nr:OmpA family protein [Cellvibrionaceae bacterium]